MKRHWFLIIVLHGVMAAFPLPFESLQGPLTNTDRMLSLDLHPTLYELNATGSAVYPPHKHRRLKEFHERRHLSRYEQLLYTENDPMLTSWNGEYDEAFFSSAKNQTMQHRFLAGGQLSQYQAVPLSQGYGTHFASLWVGTPTPQRKTVIVDTGSHYTAFPCTVCRFFRDSTLSLSCLP